MPFGEIKLNILIKKNESNPQHVWLWSASIIIIIIIIIIKLTTIHYAD